MKNVDFKSTIPNAVLNIGTVEKINQIVRRFANHLIIMMFTSDQCSACKAFLPIFKQAQKTFYNHQVIFIKVNVSDLPEVAEQFMVMGTPTTLFIRNQKGKKRIVGMVTLPKFRDVIQSYLPK